VSAFIRCDLHSPAQSSESGRPEKGKRLTAVVSRKTL
jgi:hypothetical protein